MNMLSSTTEWVQKGEGGYRVGELRAGGGGLVEREAVSSHSLLSLGQKEREKAQRGGGPWQRSNTWRLGVHI